jgi:hypothetical protein
MAFLRKTLLHEEFLPYFLLSQINVEFRDVPPHRISREKTSFDPLEISAGGYCPLERTFDAASVREHHSSMTVKAKTSGPHQLHPPHPPRPGLDSSCSVEPNPHGGDAARARQTADRHTSGNGSQSAGG